MAFSQKSQSDKSFSRQDENGAGSSQDVQVPRSLQRVVLDDKIAKLVPILLFKYQQKELITKEEMLHNVDEDYKELFPQIFREACKCMRLGCGIDVREIDPPGHIYALIPVLGLTYHGMLGDEEIIPKIDLLIVILTVIFMKGNRASEEDMWQVMTVREMLPQWKRFLVWEPWKFITEDLVQKQYVKYHQVPNSDPARYEFLWGPRAHAETSKMKILQHLAMICRRDPRSYTHLYEEALREEQAHV
ncbi:PREDICTED: melanoma-associated antigen 11-like [Chinchilla lanigera]|uniref:melanoma-associated antigen 11-like n=1 Tax=Chinchilla lanigera TaxID=34839 RepID=UPI0006985A2F|nr:PREDICTED: melanoma-associated antigen 11-like [Chinchilla lanigera]